MRVSLIKPHLLSVSLRIHNLVSSCHANIEGHMCTIVKALFLTIKSIIVAMETARNKVQLRVQDLVTLSVDGVTVITSILYGTLH